ncbi:MAG: hypothetical protein IKK34_14755 [Clostridia bacterium]|nr:hypothetical protein [Clostridia bacterium]MBR3797266.1 hypothetical protein [Clostridia bacterium]
MISIWHLLWIVPLAGFIGFTFAVLLPANARAEEQLELFKLRAAMKRLGSFGKLFIEYRECPRGAVGRACCPIEEEVLMMQPIRDVDGSEWIPVQADALRDMVNRYNLSMDMASY